MIRLSKGLTIPIPGEPEQVVRSGAGVGTVAVLGRDYAGLKPLLAVQPGDRVKLGQPLFEDKQAPGVSFTAPGAGTVKAVNRGARRSLVSIVIRLEGDEQVEFRSWSARELAGLSRQDVVANLARSGLWTAFRTRPFSKVPQLDAEPHAIFVTAMDTNPLAAAPEQLIWRREEDFKAGLAVLTRLTGGKVWVCSAVGDNLPTVAGVSPAQFGGPHPAGLPGTHIHFLDPVDAQKSVWHLGYQDVVAMGALFLTGTLDVRRVVALGGPMVREPRLVETRLGASLDELTQGELRDGEKRLISGSLLSGHAAKGDVAYLGRYHTQVCAVAETRERELLGWLKPGFGKFSERRAFAACLRKEPDYAVNTQKQGSRRAVFPTGAFDAVMPLDLVPVYLLRALCIGDADDAQLLGCLELDEEDLALCTYVDCGKNDYGTMLRNVLTTIEKEG